MPDDTDPPAWRIVTGYGRIRDLAEKHGRIPVAAKYGTAGVARRDAESEGDGETATR